MVRRTHGTDHQTESDPAAGRAAASPLAGLVRDSATQIWLAGLGAFAKAQEEGGKVFEALVKEGLDLQRKTHGAAGERISEATGKVAAMASGFSSRAAGQWDKLENLFEERVARSMHRLGAPSAKDYADLVARIERIERELALRPATEPPAGRRRSAAPEPEPEPEAQRPASRRAQRDPS